MKEQAKDSKLTLAQVTQRVADIAADSDNETAHGKEDMLYVDVLTAIAQGSPDAQALAEEALKASKLSFTRWYA